MLIPRYLAVLPLLSITSDRLFDSFTLLKVRGDLNCGDYVPVMRIG
jgi:hypothetical protein